MAADAGVPLSRLDILALRALLQQKPVATVEQQHMRYPVDERRIAMAGVPRGLANHLILFIDYIEKLDSAHDHSSFRRTTQPAVHQRTRRMERMEQ